MNEVLRIDNELSDPGKLDEVNTVVGKGQTLYRKPVDNKRLVDAKEFPHQGECETPPCEQ